MIIGFKELVKAVSARCNLSGLVKYFNIV